MANRISEFQSHACVWTSSETLVSTFYRVFIQHLIGEEDSCSDLVKNISYDTKLFADDTSLFTIVHHEGTAAGQLNRDLKVISDWAYQCKMQFNPDKNKQAIQLIFSQKRTKPVHQPIFLNESEVKIKNKQKHLGMILVRA